MNAETNGSDRNAGPGAKRALTIAGGMLAFIVLVVGCVSYHAWNKGVLAEAKDEAPDGINLEPVAGSPGSYAVSPAFDAILSVAVVEYRVPKPGEAPRKIAALDDSAWRYDEASAILSLKRPIDDEAFTVRANGNFRYPLEFTLPEGVDPDSIRLIVEGKIGLAGSDYAYDGASRRLTLKGTSAGTAWFGFSFDYLDGFRSGSVGGLGAERLTRAMRVHVGYPVDGNCVEVGGDGKRFRCDGEEAGKAPWLLELLPTGEGYVGATLELDDFSFDPLTMTIELKVPIDTAKLSVFALMD